MYAGRVAIIGKKRWRDRQKNGQTPDRYITLFARRGQPPAYNKQGVALTGRNLTGPPCSVGRPTVHAHGRRRADLQRPRRPAGPTAGSVPTPRCVSTPRSHAPGCGPFRKTAALQTTTTDDRCPRAKQYWPNSGPVLTAEPNAFVQVTGISRRSNALPVRVYGVSILCVSSQCSRICII